MAYSYKTSISFGLVHIPVTLHAATKSSDIGFRQIDRQTKSPVKYLKSCADCGNRIVQQEEIIKGYEYQKGKFVFFDNADFEKLKTQKDKTIAIEQFVNLSEIDPIYYERTFYVMPEKTAIRAFVVLTRAMEKENKVGIAKTMLGAKEAIVAVRVKNGSMLASTMYFYDEVQQNPAEKIDAQISVKEAEMAKMIIVSMTSKWQPQQFKDEYRERLATAIETKIAGQKIIPLDISAKPAKISSLMDALTKSLKQTALGKANGRKNAAKQKSAKISRSKNNVIKFKKAASS